MYERNKIVAIIPARKGSKGLSNKNIRLLNGIPLVEHSIQQAEAVDIIDKIIVSSDSDEICAIARKNGLEIKGLRPLNLADDTAELYDVVKYEILNYNLVEKGYNIVVLLQPTSPLRKSFMIRNAILEFIDNNYNSSVSVSEVEEHPIFMRTIDTNNKLARILKSGSTIRRQDLSTVYKVNGMIYINRIDDIMKNYVSFNDNTYPIIIPNKYSVDIDTVEDFNYVQKVFDSL